MAVQLPTRVCLSSTAVHFHVMRWRVRLYTTGACQNRHTHTTTSLGSRARTRERRACVRVYLAGVHCVQRGGDSLDIINGARGREHKHTAQYPPHA